MTIFKRASAVLLSVSAFFLVFSGNAVAKNSTSLGHGIKCTWVLVSSVNGVNTYNNVCRKGP